MKKTITITTCNRPKYLKRVLSSLSKNNLSGYKLYFFCEPINNECIKICQNVDFIDKEVIVHKERQGVRRNPYLALQYVFDKESSDVNLYLEDDVVVSPDATKVAEWFYDRSINNDILRFHVPCVNLFNYTSKSYNEDNILKWKLVKDFNALGLCITKYGWYRWFEPHWFKDYPTIGGTGWDWSILHLIKTNSNFYGIQPIIARSNHIGREGGTHCSNLFTTLSDARL